MLNIFLVLQQICILNVKYKKKAKKLIETLHIHDNLSIHLDLPILMVISNYIESNYFYIEHFFIFFVYRGHKKKLKKLIGLMVMGFDPMTC
jgi:hypothetical protein